MPRDPRKGAPATVNEEILDRGVRHAVYLESVKNRTVREIVGMMNRDTFAAMIEDATIGLERLNRDSSIDQLIKSRNFRDTMDRIGTRLTDGLAIAHGALVDQLTEIGSMESEWQAKLLKKVLPPEVKIDFKTPTPEFLRAVATKRPFQGAILSEWYQKLETKAQFQVRQGITLGLMNGESTKQIVNRLRGTQDSSFANGVFEGTRRDLEAVARTATNHVANAAREDVFLANDDIVEEVQWVSTLDSRTTITCASLDGQRFKPGEGPRPPAHYGCRSTVVPVITGWGNLGLKAPKPSTRASLNGKAADALTYPDWLRKQPAAVRQHVLGKTRAAAFDAGAPISSFVDNKSRVLSVADLRRLEPDIFAA